MADYDIGDALLRIESILLKSMGRNLHRHLGEEDDEERRWTMWQAEQLTGLNQWSARNLKRCSPEFRRINDAAAELLREANRQGELDEEERLLADGIQQAAEFFHPPGDRFDALLKAVRSDLSRAEHSLLRQADDTYRRALFDAHAYLQTGAGDLNRAIDMAVGDLYVRGIRSVLYRNGRRVEASTYARMALRSASVRARLMGEGKARDKMGIHTVIVPPSGIACAKCAVWMGRVLVDDVYSSGTAQEAAELGVPLLSDAVEQGFLHPQCNCMPVTYRPGISKPPEPVTDEERENAVKRYKLTQKQRYNERQIRKWKQQAEDAPDDQTKNECKARVRSWQRANKQLCDENHDFLRRDYEREKIYRPPEHPVVPNVIDKTPPEPEKPAPIPETREKPTTVSETMAAPEQTPEPKPVQTPVPQELPPVGIPKSDPMPTLNKEISESDESDVLRALFGKSSGKTYQETLAEFDEMLPRVENKKVYLILKRVRDRTEFMPSDRKNSYFQVKDKDTNKIVLRVRLARSATPSTVAHELFHKVYYEEHIDTSGLLDTCLSSDYERLKKLSETSGQTLEDMLYLKYPEAFIRKGKMKESYRGVSDIINGMTGGKVWLGYGRKNKGYWSQSGRLQKEAFAQYGRFYFEENQNVLRMITELFPDTTKIVDNVISAISQVGR